MQKLEKTKAKIDKEGSTWEAKLSEIFESNRDELSDQDIQYVGLLLVLNHNLESNVRILVCAENYGALSILKIYLIWMKY